MPWWLNISFEAEIRDSRPQLRCDYDGLTLHIEPSQEEKYADTIAIFSADSEMEDVRLRVNRFLSAMAWKDGKRYVTLGSAGHGTASFDRKTPIFFSKYPRESPYAINGQYDFDHLQNPPGENQKLALALYRDGLGVNNEYYRFLNFYKIINILNSTGAEQKAWINANLSKIDHAASERLVEIQANATDVGNYLYIQGRCAIAHAFGKPIRDPDVPNDLLVIAKDIPLMRALAELFIEQQLDVPSTGKIWRQHLYELAGFKSLFGQELTERIKRRENVSVNEFPSLPAINICSSGQATLCTVS